MLKIDVGHDPNSGEGSYLKDIKEPGLYFNDYGVFVLVLDTTPLTRIGFTKHPPFDMEVYKDKDIEKRHLLYKPFYGTVTITHTKD